MKLRLLLLCFLTSFYCLSQQAVKHHFEYHGARLEQVLADVENTFDIRYSYADSLVAPMKITLPPAQYSLTEINGEIERQAGLRIAKIDNRYYSLYFAAMPVNTLEEIVVEGFLSKGINKSPQNFILSPKKISALPGVTDADVLFSLQQLPGVKSPNETASGLHVRGGTPDQNLVLWDGIRMYHPGHLFGMISGFNPNVARTVNFYNKAASPKFGERISGIIDIRTDDKTDSLQGEIGLNGLNADAYLKIPLSENLGLQLSGRKSYTEWLQTPTFNALGEKVFQNTDLNDFDNGNQFGFQDYAVNVNFEHRDDKILFSGIAIDNHLDFFSGSDGIRRNQKMDVRNYGFSGNWRHKFGKLEQEILLYYSAYTFDYENNRQYAPGNFEWFVKKNRVTDSGIELNYDYAWHKHFSIDFGYQLSGNDLSHIFLNRLPGLEAQLGQKHLMNVAHAGYGHFRYAPGMWIFQAGARYNYFNRLKEDSFEPRLSVQKKLTQKFIAQVSYERKSQIVSQIRESVTNDISLENYVWILSDGDQYPVQKANQFTAGLTYKTKSFLIDADVYYKTTDGVTSLAFGFLHQYDSEIHRGDGFTKGLDLLLQKSAPDWRAWLTYTYPDSQNRYEGLNNADYFPISTDIRHALTLSFHKRWDRFSASAGWFWHTGKPYSKLNEDNEITSFNNQRLPVYHRLDISAAYQFRTSKSWSGKAGFSILNVYGRHSLISREYERQFADGGLFETHYTVRDYQSLGFAPNVFVRFSF